MTKSLLESLIREILSEGRQSIPRSPGYDEALRDTNRSQQSIADEFGLSRTAVLKDRRPLGIVTGLKGGPGKESRPPSYDEALRDTSRSSYDVANEFGFNPATVASDRRDAGIVTGLIGGPPRKVRTAEYEAAIRDATRTSKSIHDEFGIPLEIITNDRRVLGIETGLKGGQPRRARPPGYEEALRDSSRSLQSVASEFGVSGPTVLRDRRALAIPASKDFERRQAISLPDSYEEEMQSPAIQSMSIEDDFETSDAAAVGDKESTGDDGRRRSRPPGYEEALRDVTRTHQEVADAFGFNLMMIRRDRQALGLKMPLRDRSGRRRSARPPGYEEALQDVTRTHQEVADAFGFNIITVFRDRQAAGIKMKMRGSRPRAMPDMAQSSTPEFKPTVDPDKDPSLSVRDFPPVSLPIRTEPARYDDELDYEDEPEDVDILSLYGRIR